MPSFIYFCSFFLIVSSFLLSCISAAPISAKKEENPYDIFIEFLSKNNCTMPKEVELPFPPSSDQTPFSYLSTPLKECQTSNALKKNEEAYMLCKEVFDVLQNITCFESSTLLPKIESNYLSQNVCSDFKAMKDIFPKQNDYLSSKLTDDIICKLLCTSNKYELLCKTVLWSYETQAKIRSAVEIKLKEIGKEHTNGNSSEMVPGVSSIKATSGQDTLDSNNQEINNKVTKEISIGNEHLEHKDLNNSSTRPNIMISTASGQIASDKIDYSTSNSQNEKSMSITTISENPKVKNESEADNQKVMHKEDLQSNKSDQNMQSKDIDHKKNEITEEILPITVKENIQGNPNTNSLITQSNNVKDSQNGKNISEHILQGKENDKDNINNDINTKIYTNSDGSIPKNTEMDNELSNVNFEEQENETKVKQTNLKTSIDKDKKLEKPELTDFETSNGGVSSVDSKPLESTTLQILPDKDEDLEQHQEDKDQEQYNDTENEGDYPKAEYDNSFNPPVKNKESDAKSSIISGSSSNNYDTFISSRNNIGRVPDDIQMIPSFPEQEDSHFFFYFLSIVLILMAGYLIFHNKQKIIALIVEGRHERRRRSHGAGYKKLETK